LLQALEFEVEDKGDYLLVTSPDHRLDIEGSHDLIEEVCRVYGYDRIPTTEMADSLPSQSNNTELSNEERIKDILVESDLQEIITYRLTTPEREAKLLPDGSVPPDDRPYVTLTNPITVDRVAMRHSLLASVLETTAANSRFRDRIALFELGQIYLAGEEGILPDELRRLALVVTGLRDNRHWLDKDAPEGMDFFDLKGILEELFDALHIEGLTFAAGKHPTFRPGQTARLLLGEQQIGWLGRLHPAVVEGFDIRGGWPVIAAEIDLELVFDHIPDRHRVEPVPVFPAVHEDIALILDKGVIAADVQAIIEKAGGFLLKAVELFDIYEGSSIPAGKKSLAYHLTFQSPAKTLTDKETRRNRERIVQQLEKQLGAKLREG
jgi:phenylalanyl-tRNA synthetase beta chain